MSHPHVIRTPDQRLRIFVSSTLQELAAERRAARTAIERLHLAPVMFELGARPHPPRELYRSYLQQSDVFLGLYWERYGWVAPDEQVSGLEDEYNLCPDDVPRLLYVKVSDHRDERLTGLLNRIREDDRAAYKYFETSKELARLVEADLAILLAERFDQSRTTVLDESDPALPTIGRSGPDPAVADPVRLPMPLTGLVGRERDIAELHGMLASGTRFVTLVGPGGIGKSRLAIAAARASAPDFEDGSVFVDLSAVHDPERVPSRIAQALGVRDTGDAPMMENLATALRERSILLVLDNFEQVVEAAPALTTLLAEAPELAILVTSRVLLRISGEQSYDVGPLADEPAVDLFVERAHAVKPDFEITPDNEEAVERVCDALDGVPLAIELAAARVRVLSPAELLDRLDRRLSVLVGGPRDLPARQQTIRRTIEWSTQLLESDQRKLLARLGVFEGGFTLEAAESVGSAPAGRDDPSDADPDVLENLAALVDSSLVGQHDSDDRPRFSMQAIVREYAREQLAGSGEQLATRDAHARYFLALGDDAEDDLRGAGQRRWMQRLGDERDNLRAAERFLLDGRDWDRAARLAFSLYLYWWVTGLLGEVRTWMEEALTSGDELDPHTRAVALYFSRTIMFWKDPDGSVAADLAESIELFRRTGDPNGEGLASISLALALLAGNPPDTARARRVMEAALALYRSTGSVWGESMALVLLGRVALREGDLAEAQDHFTTSLALTNRSGDRVGQRIASYHLGWTELMLGDVAAARSDFALSVTISAAVGHPEGIAYGLEGMVAVAALLHDDERAGELAGAAQALRERSGLHNGPTFTFHRRYLDDLLSGPNGDVVAAAIADGRELTVEQAVSEALAEGRGDEPPGATPSGS